MVYTRNNLEVGMNIVFNGTRLAHSRHTGTIHSFEHENAQIVIVDPDYDKGNLIPVYVWQIKEATGEGNS